MKKEKLKDYLKTFGYKFEETESVVKVNLDFSQIVIVNFGNPERIIISDGFEGLNFLTGLISMPLKIAVVYNIIMSFMLVLVLGFIQNLTSISAYFYILIFLLFNNLIFMIYYLIKLESFKSKISNFLMSN